MKSASFVALVGALVLGASASAQTIPYALGDVIIGFRAQGGTGSTSNFVYNTGLKAYDLRDGNFTPGVIGVNLDSALAAVYGAGWATRTDLFWGAVAITTSIQVIGVIPGGQNGDTYGTGYVSTSTTAPDSSSVNTPTKTQLQGGATGISDFQTGSGVSMDNTTATTSDGQGGTMSTSDTQAWSVRVANGNDFGMPIDIEDAFGTGIDYLDFYRLSGTDPVVPTYVTTFSLDDSGNLSVVPEPGFYAAALGLVSAGLIWLRRRRRVAA